MPSVASIKDPEKTTFEFLDYSTTELGADDSSKSVSDYPQVSDIKQGVQSNEKASVSSIQSIKEQVAIEFDHSIISDPWLDESSDTVESYPKVSTLKETTATPEMASKASLESDDSVISESQLKESLDTIEPDVKVSSTEETGATSENLSDSATAILEKQTALTAPNAFEDQSLSPTHLDQAIAAESTTEQETAQETTPIPGIEDSPDTEPPVVPVPETIPPPDSDAEETETTAEEPRVLVVEVVVEGAGPELQDLVYNTIQTRPGRTATRSQLQEDVNAIYATGYFANVEVTPADTPLGVRISYNVEVNPILEEVVVNTVPDIEDQRALPPEKVQEIFGDQYGEILNLRELQEGIRAINEWYAEQGFDLAQVIGSPEVSEDGIVTLVIAEGVIEDVQVRFFDAEDEPVDGRTRDFIVTRE
ncbi:POTRA domain-containing protein, partial [Crocosphaera chwakensis]